MAAPKRPILWSPEAEADLTSIWSYYAEVAGPEIRGTDDSGDWRDVRDAGNASSDWPRTQRDPARDCVPCPHVIFYRAHGDEVQIVRVLDGRRDIDEIFADDT